MRAPAACLGAVGEPDPGVLLAQLAGLGHTRLVLLSGLERSLAPLGEDAVDEVGAVGGELVVELPRREVGGDGSGGLSENLAGVHSLGEGDDAVAGDLVPGEDRRR